MGLYSITLTGIENQILDAARSGHTTAGSIGEFFQEMMDQAVQSGHTTESAMDILRRVSGEATGGATSDSLMHRIENPASAPTAAVVADAVWDEVRADHTTAATAGEFLQEMMDQAVESDNTTESGLDVIRRISAETMGTVTANSLMAKLTGMTDAQAVATAGGPTLAEDSARFTITTAATLEIQPGSGEFDIVTVQPESIDNADYFFSVTDGTNVTAYDSETQGDLQAATQFIVSTNVIRFRLKNLNAATKTFQRAIQTVS